MTSLASIAPETGATVSSTGGTSDPIGVLGSDFNNLRVHYPADANNVARQVNFSVKRPTISAAAPGGYTQGRRTVFYQKPKVLDNGNRTVDTIKFELSCDPENTDAEILLMFEDFKQLLVDAEIVDFITDQQIA